MGENLFFLLFAKPLAALIPGAVGVYMMIPRGQPSGRILGRLIGGALATLSLVLLATLPLGGPAGGQAHVFWQLEDRGLNICFWMLAVITLVSAVLMITSRNPVYSALWFSLVLLSNSGMFFLVNADFLGAATIIIYAGAIIVTFLFVIMLAQPRGTAAYDRISREPFLTTCITGLVLSVALLAAISHAERREVPGEVDPVLGTMRPSTAEVQRVAAAGPRTERIDERRPHLDGLGRTLFVQHFVSVEVIGLLLLAAVVGALMIATHPVPARGGKAGG